METGRRIKCIILEDEYYTAHEICRLLKGYNDRYSVMNIFERCEDFVQFIDCGELPDLIVSNLYLADGFIGNIPKISELEIPFILTYLGNSFNFPQLQFLVGMIEKPVTKNLLYKTLEQYETNYSPLTHYL